MVPDEAGRERAARDGQILLAACRAVGGAVDPHDRLRRLRLQRRLGESPELSRAGVADEDPPWRDLQIPRVPDENPIPERPPIKSGLPHGPLIPQRHKQITVAIQADTLGAEAVVALEGEEHFHDKAPLRIEELPPTVVVAHIEIPEAVTGDLLAVGTHGVEETRAAAVDAEAPQQNPPPIPHS